MSSMSVATAHIMRPCAHLPILCVKKDVKLIQAVERGLDVFPNSHDERQRGEAALPARQALHVGGLLTMAFLIHLDLWATATSAVCRGKLAICELIMLDMRCGLGMVAELAGQN